jgi:hypothetical protein
MLIFSAFFYLQVLDLITTLVGFRLGLGEASPFVRWMMDVGPAYGVLASKVIALLLAGLCVYLNKMHVIRWITVWYAGLVVWNLGLIWVVAAGR